MNRHIGKEVASVRLIRIRPGSKIDLPEGSLQCKGPYSDTWATWGGDSDYIEVSGELSRQFPGCVVALPWPVKRVFYDATTDVEIWKRIDREPPPMRLFTRVWLKSGSPTLRILAWWRGRALVAYRRSRAPWFGICTMHEVCLTSAPCHVEDSTGSDYATRCQ